MFRKHIFLFVTGTIVLLLSSLKLYAQPTGASCAAANPFCSSQTYNFENNNATSNNLGTSSPSGPNYGCLFSQPRPIWYYMQIGQTGPISLTLRQTTGQNGTGSLIDVDFAMWGPFNDLTAGCNAIMAGGMPPIQCSFSASATETLGIGAAGGTGSGASTPPAGQVGQIYIVLLTNYSQQRGYITLNQTGGSGATNCGILSAVQNNGPLCVGATLNLTANNVAGATSWSWTGPNGFTSNLQNPAPITNVTQAHAGVYTMTVAAQGSTATYSTTVVIDNPPVAAITKVDATCGLNNGSATVTATGSSPFTYQWSPVGGTSATANGLSMGSYSVIVTDSKGCKDTVQTTIDTLPSFQLSITSIVHDMCGLGQGSVQVQATGGSGNFTYSWSGGNGSASSAVGLYGGTYICTVSDGVCTKTISATVNGVLPLNASITSNIDKFCQTLGIATVQATGGTPPYTYTWTTGGETDPLDSNVNPNMQHGNNSVLVTDANNCTFNVDFVTRESPDTMIISDNVVNASCNDSDGSISLNVVGGTGPYTFAWSGNNETTCTCVSTSNVLDSIRTGYYTATITDLNGCVKLYTAFVNQPPMPVAAFGIDSSLVQKGEPTLWIIDQSENANTRFYEFNDGTDSRFDNSGIFEHNYNGSEDILFCVTQTVNLDLCYDTVTHCLPIIGEYTMFIPNSFTPDDDKLNDQFRPKGKSIRDYSMVIFDRWGTKEVFRTELLEEGWDGTMKNMGNEFLPQGTYVYRIEVKTFKGKEYTYMGHINLFR